MEQQKKLHQLFFPIFFEILFMMLTGAVDTLMLSSVGDQAVGAVGTANTYIGIFIIMFSIISSGVMAVMTQYIGAERPGVARQAMKLGLCFNAVVGVILTEENEELKAGYIALIGLAKNILEQCIDILGFTAPEKM